MFKLKSKDQYEKIMFWKKFLFSFLNVCLMIYIFFSFLLFYNSNLNFYVLNLLIIFIWFTFNFVFNQIFDIILNLIYRRKTTLELLEILKDTKLPKNLPKVVYVYTTHNDFWEARLLQSMRQTYPNIEYWISNGSVNSKMNDKIKEFARRHNINYHSLNRPSIHKADNLNHFLKHSGATFDYLLISDSDVAIDRNFVTTSLKFFYSKNQKRLGWVSSFIQVYKSNNLYNNIVCNVENIGNFSLLNKNHQTWDQANLHSSTSLIKKEMLEEFDMLFPNSCLEDWWLEFLSTKQNWIGLINPFTISLESFDKNIVKGFKRWFRIYDWIIKLIKEDFFRRPNEAKQKFYHSYFKVVAVYPFKIIFYPIIMSICIFIGIVYWQTIISHYEYIIILSLFTIIFATHYLVKLSKSIFFLKWKIIPFLCFKVLIETSIFWYSGIRFINSFFRSKYATFESSRGNNDKDKNRFLIVFTIISIAIIILNCVFIIFNIYKINLYLLFVFILLNVVFDWIWLSIFSFYLLYAFSFIKTNKKYNENDFVYCKNDLIQQKKTINKWCIINNLNFDEILHSH